MMRILILLSIFLMPLSELFAYSFIRGKYGESAHWPSHLRTVSMYYSDSNESGISSSDVRRIFEDSAAQWSGKSSISMSINPTPVSTTSSGRNEIFFSTNPTYFGGGSGVVGVTQVVFKEGTGEIVEADIILNEASSQYFNTTETEKFYLGNVVTHEMGHVMGLGHSERQFSSMFYRLTERQHTVSSDDESGLFSLYPNSYKKGSITGKVVGGDSLKGVFGTHVQAISHTTGKAVAAAFSEDDGSFSINGLPLDDTYYIYTAPPKYLPALSAYYQSARTNFCDGGNEYRGSFFEGCDSADTGFPTAINLNQSSKSKHLGNVTIKCQQDAPTSYIEQAGMDFNYVGSEIVSEAFVGFFAPSDISTSHTITVDLRSHDAFEAGTHFNLRLLSQVLYSKLKIHAEIYEGFGNDLSAPSYTFDNTGASENNSEGDPTFDVGGTFPLNTDFLTIKIVSEKILSSGSDLDLYLPDSSAFADNLPLYLMSFGLKSGSGLDAILEDGTHVEDNTYCPDASSTYTVSANSSTYVPKKLITKKEMAGVSCGSVTIDDGGGPGGPMSFMVGLCLIFLMSPKRLLGKIQA